jgi:hypothetical protein
MKKQVKIVTTLLLVLMLALTAMGAVSAQATTKQLSTNFTLVNLGDTQATGTINYYKPDGTKWGTTSPETFQLAANGGQMQYRQYANAGDPGNPGLENGQGSVVVESDAPLGAVVQIKARNQNPTSNGAYAGLAAGAGTFVVPLVLRAKNTAGGLGNSQIIVQNAGGAATNVAIDVYKTDGTIQYTKSIANLAKGASSLYDLATESAANIPNNFMGSAVVRATTSGGLVAVVSNMFQGDALMTFNAFPDTAATAAWAVPSFFVRLGNGLSSVVSVQNLSGGTIPIGGLTLICRPAPGSAVAGFQVANTKAVGDKANYDFNAYTDTTMNTKFTGSCAVSAGTAKVVAFVQLRYPAQGEAAAYEAIPIGGTDKTMMVPLVLKRLGNGFATVVTIQNMSLSASANITMTYNPSPEYLAANPSAQPVVIKSTIAAASSIQQNHRLASGGDAVPQLPDKWNGSLVVESDQAVNGFVQITVLSGAGFPAKPAGDSYMAHDVFTRP